MNHFINIHDFSKQQLEDILVNASHFKKQLANKIEHKLLKGKVVGMIFSKASTRTRVSFEAGAVHLGMYPLFLNSNDIQLGRGETISDTAHVLSRYLDCIIIRTFKHSDVEELAKEGGIPIINALTDLSHPCQIMADFMTVIERKGSLNGIKIAYVGDGNNVANTLLSGASKLGVDISIACPDSHQCDADVVRRSLSDAEQSGAKLVLTNDAQQAVSGADVVYTDTWVSMGDEAEKDVRSKIFMPYQVNKQLMSLAQPDAIFLHCLPAYRGMEVTSDVIDGPQSAVIDQAENRLHVQKAIMVNLLGN